MKPLCIFEKQYLLAATQNGGRTWTLAEASIKGKKIIVTAIKERVGKFTPKGAVQLSVGARQSYILRQEFPTKDRKLLNLQVSRKLKQIGLWSDTDTLYISLISEPRPNEQNLVTAIAIPGSEFDPILEQLSLSKGARPRAIFPFEAAVAGLLGEITSDPVLSIYFSSNYVKLLLTIDKVPLFVQLIPVSEEGLGQNLLEYNIEKALDQAHKLYNGSVEKIIAFGSVPAELPSIIGKFRLWKPEWHKIIHTEKPEAIIKYPALFGMPFANYDFDMRPSNWKLAYTLQRASTIVTGIAASGVALFSICSLLLHGYNCTLEKRQNEYSALLAKREKALRDRMPTQNQIQKLQQWVELNKKYADEPNINILMGRFAQCLPPKVKILDMKITRYVSPSQTSPEISGNFEQLPMNTATGTISAALKNPLQIIGKPWESEFTIITNGSFSSADSRLKNTVARFQSYFQLKDVSRTYDESKQRGILHLKITAKDEQQT